MIVAEFQFEFVSNYLKICNFVWNRIIPTAARHKVMMTSHVPEGI